MPNYISNTVLFSHDTEIPMRSTDNEIDMDRISPIICTLLLKQHGWWIIEVPSDILTKKLCDIAWTTEFKDTLTTHSTDKLIMLHYIAVAGYNERREHAFKYDI